MSKVISIIELYQHDEVLHHFLQLLGDSDYSIEIYCSQQVFQSLNELHAVKNIIWIPMKTEDSISSFLHKNKDRIKRSTITIFTTVFSHFNSFYNLIGKQKTLLVFHNVHWQLNPSGYYKIMVSSFVRDILRIGKSWLLNAAQKRKKLSNAVNAIVVGSDEVRDYIHSNKNMTLSKPVLAIPFGCYQKETPKRSQKNYVAIMIPGVVSDENRDYDQVWYALQNINSALKEKVQVTLLGGAKGKSEQRIIQKFSTFTHPDISIVTFTSNLSFQEYNSKLKEADFLIIPAREKTTFDTCIEYNGFSKILGTLNDTIKFGKPTLIPATYPLAPNLEELVEPYSSVASLSKKIILWVNNEVYTQKEKNTKVLQNEYSHEVLRKRLLKNIQDLENDRTFFHAKPTSKDA